MSKDHTWNTVTKGYPTKIFADQVTAKLKGHQLYILLSFDQLRALEIHDVAVAMGANVLKDREPQKPNPIPLHVPI